MPQFSRVRCESFSTFLQASVGLRLVGGGDTARDVVSFACRQNFLAGEFEFRRILLRVEVLVQIPADTQENRPDTLSVARGGVLSRVREVRAAYAPGSRCTIDLCQAGAW